MTVQSGQVIKSYRVIEKIDSGGFGEVYRAYQPVIEREVAIKVILPRYANEVQFIRRFEGEAQLVARLEHPHIVPLYDYWRDPDGAYLVMRWLRGGNVRDYIIEHPMSLEMTSKLLDQICGALTVAHRNGVVHRDLKPENILRDIDENFYLTDFGISAQVGQESDTDSISGSAKYIAPEQLQSEPPTILSDIYSLGVVLFEVLAGQHPYGTGSVSEMIYKALSEPLPPLNEFKTGFPPAVDMVIHRATEKDPDMRYASAQELANAFRNAIGRERTTVEVQGIDETFEITNPYKGLQAFDEADAMNFFGREKLVDTLIKRLQRSSANFLALVGPSGSGKSSVLRAGLIPALRQHSITNFEGWFVVDMVPGSDPIGNLHAALLSIAVDAPNDLLDRLKSSPRGLLWAAEKMLRRMGGNLLLFIDQFEELFLQVEDDSVRDHFLQLLYRVATSDTARLFVVVSIRADFFDRPLLYEGIGDLVQQNTQVVLPLSSDELERAIVGPAQRVGLQIDTSLVAAIIADVREEAGALPLLQYALTELFERRDGNQLTLEAYHESGGVQGALARRAEEVYQSLDDDLKPIARQIFLRLVTLGEGNEDTRRRAKRAELLAVGENREAINKVIDAFGHYRLLTFDSDSSTREPTVDIAHEALIRNWALLRQWLADGRSDIRLQRALNQAATDWDNNKRESGYLLHGGRLVQFEEWAETTSVALVHLETSYLAASIAEREYAELLEQERIEREAKLERRSRLLLQATVAVFAVLGIISGVLAFVASQQSQSAQVARDAAVDAQQTSDANAEAAVNAQLTSDSNAINAQEARDDALVARETSDANAISAQEARDEAVVAQQTSDANAIRAQEQLEIANLRAAQIQNLNLLNVADDAIATGDSGLSMQLITSVIDSNILSPAIYNNLYDVAYQSLLRDRLVGHTKKVTALAVSRNGRWLATGSEDATVIVWDIATGNIVAQLTDHRGPINSLVFSQDSLQLASAATDATATVWRTLDFEIVVQLRGHRNVLTDVAFTPDGTKLLTSSGDRTVQVWDIATGTSLLQFSDHEESVRTVAVHPNGEWALSGGRDNMLLLWNIETGDVRRHFSGHEAEIQSVAIDTTGTTALSASADKSVILWDIETGKVIHRFDGHSDIVTDVAYHHDTSTAVSTSCAERDANRACVEGEIIVWDVDARQEVRRMIGHIDEASAVAYALDGSIIYTGSCAERRQSACIEGEVLVWDSQKASDVRFPLVGHRSGVHSVAISPDEEYVVTGGGTGLSDNQAGGDTSIILWHLPTGEFIQRMVGHTGDVNSVIFSSDNNTVFSGSSDGTIRQWDLATGSEIRRFEGHNGVIYNISISPDGRNLVSAGSDRMIRWDVASGEVIQSFDDLGSNLIAQVVAFNPAGDTFISGLNNGSIILWNAFGQEIRRYVGHTDDILALSFSPTGEFLLSGSADHTARLWNVRTTEIIAVYQGHTEGVTGVAFRPNAEQFLTVSNDDTMRLWDVESSEVIRTFYGHTADIIDVSLSQSSNVAVTASNDGTALVWRTSLEALESWIKENRYIRELTPKEADLFRLVATESE